VENERFFWYRKLYIDVVKIFFSGLKRIVKVKPTAIADKGFVKIMEMRLIMEFLKQM